jgi:hypothetical protein
MNNNTPSHIQIVLLEQQLEQAHGENALQQKLLAAQDGEIRAHRAALTAKDGELQALRALASVRAACSSADAAPRTSPYPDAPRNHSLRLPLDDDELLDTVFSFVGPGDYFYAAGVCRRWRGRYIKLCYNKAAADQADKLRTTYRCAFMTAARLHLAFKSGLDVEELHDYTDLAVDIAANSLEPIEAITLAKTYDMRYPEDMAGEAASNGRLQLLQWLHERRCPWSDKAVVLEAVRSGSVEMLVWLQGVTAPWSDALKEDLLYELIAANIFRPDAAQWLSETAQAPWHIDLHAASLVFDFTFSDTVVRWVLTSKRCCWDGWDCKALAAKQHDTEATKQLAAELFALAHQHGCPCTCDAAD